MKTVMILGTEYRIKKKKYKRGSYFDRKDCDGYCDDTVHEIVYCDMHTHPSSKKEPEKVIQETEKHIVRHEVIHAFFSESGLAASSAVVGYGWAENEEMVDWLAIQSPKIFQVFQELDIL